MSKNWPTYALVLAVGAWALTQMVSNRSLTPVRCGQDLVPDNDTVVMLSASWCGYCRQARRFLQGEHIKHCEYDVEADAEGRRRATALGTRGVPVFVLRGQAFVGYDRDTLGEALVAKGLWGASPQ